MNHRLTNLLCLISISMVCSSCTHAWTLPQNRAAAPLVPEFSGGRGGPEIAQQKAALTEEYRQLALAEQQLKREKDSLSAVDLGRRSFTGTHMTRIGAVSLDTQKVKRHEANITRLRQALSAAGVTVTVHR